MPDIQKIKLPDGTSYDIMDANAIHDPSEKSADNYLKYNGTEWTAASIPTTSHTLEGTELVIETDLGRDTSEFLKVTGGTMSGNLNMEKNTVVFTDEEISKYYKFNITPSKLEWKYDYQNGNEQELCSIEMDGNLVINGGDILQIKGRGVNVKASGSEGYYLHSEVDGSAAGFEEAGQGVALLYSIGPTENPSAGLVRLKSPCGYVSFEFLDSVGCRIGGKEMRITSDNPEGYKVYGFGTGKVGNIYAVEYTDYNPNYSDSPTVIFNKSTYLGGLSDPIKYNDAATKSYVDNKFMEFSATTKITLDAGKAVTNKVWEGLMSSIAVVSVYPTNLPASCLFSYNVGSDALSLTFYNAGEQSLSETSVNIVIIGEYKTS